MANTIHRDLKALHRLVNQADLVLAAIPSPDASIASARESLNAALRLSRDLVSRPITEALKVSPAAALGSKGGAVIAKRGSDYFRQLAAKRKNRAGGRPRKTE